MDLSLHLRVHPHGFCTMQIQRYSQALHTARATLVFGCHCIYSYVCTYTGHYHPPLCGNIYQQQPC